MKSPSWVVCGVLSAQARHPGWSVEHMVQRQGAPRVVHGILWFRMAPRVVWNTCRRKKEHPGWSMENMLQRQGAPQVVHGILSVQEGTPGGLRRFSAQSRHPGWSLDPLRFEEEAKYWLRHGNGILGGLWSVFGSGRHPRWSPKVFGVVKP